MCGISHPSIAEKTRRVLSYPIRNVGCLMFTLPAADPGTPDGRSATRYLVWLARRTWLSLGAAILLAVLWMVCQALVPAVVGKAIDAGVTTRDGRALLIWGLVLLGIGLLQAAANIG